MKRGVPIGYKHAVRAMISCMDCGISWPITTANRLRCPACVRTENNRLQARYMTKNRERLLAKGRAERLSRRLAAGRSCALCNKRFIPVKKHAQKYCSKSCRDAAHYPKVKVRAREWGIKSRAALTALRELGISAPSQSTALNALIELGIEV